MYDLVNYVRNKPQTLLLSKCGQYEERNSQLNLLECLSAENQYFVRKHIHTPSHVNGGKKHQAGLKENIY